VTAKRDREEERVKELKKVRGLSHVIFASTLITYSQFCYTNLLFFASIFSQYVSDLSKKSPILLCCRKRFYNFESPDLIFDHVMNSSFEILFMKIGMA